MMRMIDAARMRSLTTVGTPRARASTKATLWDSHRDGWTYRSAPCRNAVFLSAVNPRADLNPFCQAKFPDHRYDPGLAAQEVVTSEEDLRTMPGGRR